MIVEYQKQTSVVQAVESALAESDFEKACFEAGKFIESVATRAVVEKIGSSPSRPPSAKKVLDILIEQKLVDRVLGYKLHVVRELRNVYAHQLPHAVSRGDAEFAAMALNEFLAWINQDELTREWNAILRQFEDGIQILTEKPPFHYSEDKQIEAALGLYRAFERAAHIRATSLNLPTHGSFFRIVEALAQHGLDVRSNAWRDLVTLRSHYFHEGPNVDFMSMIEKVFHSIPELRKLMKLLDPFGKRDPRVSNNSPRVILSPEPKAK